MNNYTLVFQQKRRNKKKVEIKEAITKTNELKRKIKDKQYIQVRKDGTDSYGYIEALNTLVRALKMYIK